MAIDEKVVLELIKKFKKRKKLLKNREEKIKEISRLKREIAKNYKIPFPSNLEVLKTYFHLLKKGLLKKDKEIEEILKARPVRSLSGIVNISVLTKSYPCPGRCLFCPKEPGLPKSYIEGEPAVERAKRLNFDPYLQVKKRIEVLKIEGHPTDKIELRIIGGTFSAYPKNYQIWFLKECFRGANEAEKMTSLKDTEKEIKKLKIKSLKKLLFQEQKINENAKNRIVGISIETRPDFINKKEILHLRELGVTMVELGVQTVFDDILKLNKTGTKVKDIVESTRLLKDAGFKAMYQMMPGLYGSCLKKDKEAFEKIFNDEGFKPDWLKIYPLLVLKNTEIYKLYKEKRYKPYSLKKLISLLVYIKKICPPWVRIARIYRDIPKEKIVSGSKFSNLRELVQEEMKKKNLFCRCLRCREIRGKYNPKEKIYLKRIDYFASFSREIFLSFENKNGSVFSFLRLRIPSFSIFPFLKNSAIIREIQTYGPLIPLNKKGKGVQHQGLGKRLIKEAERIAKKEFSLKKMVVISGVGARNYYRKLNYKLFKTYMIKNL